MSLTPNTNSESKTTVRSAVHTSGGISKTLLTPCRRIGLSRKTPKTISSLLKNSPVALPTSAISQKAENIENLCSTPKLHYGKEKEIKKDKNGITNDSTNIIKNNRILVSILSEKIKISEILVDSKSQNNDKLNKNTIKIQKEDRNYKKNVYKNKESKMKEKSEKESLIDEIAELKKLNQTQKNSKGKSRKKKIKLSSSSDEDVFIENLKKESTKRNEENSAKKDNKLISDESLINSPKAKLKFGSIKKCLSLKRSLSYDRSSTEESEDEITFKKKTFTFSSQESTLDHTLETISDFNKLIDETTHIEKEQIVAALQKKIANKKKYLEELQRSEVYKKTQNVNELRHLTDTWKKGCECALRDLLKQLQKHCQINMETLLNNLKVPTDKISYDPLNDVFL